MLALLPPRDERFSAIGKALAIAHITVHETFLLSSFLNCKHQRLDKKRSLNSVIRNAQERTYMNSVPSLIDDWVFNQSHSTHASGSTSGVSKVFHSEDKKKASLCLSGVNLLIL